MTMLACLLRRRASSQYHNTDALSLLPSGWLDFVKKLIRKLSSVEDRGPTDRVANRNANRNAIRNLDL